jgi:hypothetical protein
MDGVTQIKAIKTIRPSKIIIIFKTIFTIEYDATHLNTRILSMNRLPASAGKTRFISQMPVAAA